MGERKVPPTKDAEAFSSFIRGRAVFQAYLDSNNGEELLQARSHFTAATARDSDFDIARLYLAVTQTELRDPQDAIENLQTLVQKKSYLPEAHVQLAYAHIKLYQDNSYVAAEMALNEAALAAKREKRQDIIGLIEAYHVFLLAVRGAYGHDAPAAKKDFLERAISEGQDVLRTAEGREISEYPSEKLAMQFEAHNALGGALMFLARLFPDDKMSGTQLEGAESHLNAALLLRPNSVRALQNLGRLLMFQGDRAVEQPTKAREFYARAKETVKKSLQLNPYDQYPHYQMALLSVRTGDWPEAEAFVQAGKGKKGAVSAEKWGIVEKAVAARDPAQILQLDS